MPAYPNFALLLPVSEDGRTVTLTGPMPQDVEAAIVRLVAVVRQPPTEAPPDIPRALAEEERLRRENEARSGVSVTAESEKLVPSKEEWTIEATLDGTAVFDDGWAHATATALLIKPDGAMDTYTWSSWVWLAVEDLASS